MRGIGIDNFVLYDAGGVDEEMKRLLEPFSEAKELSVVDFTKQHLYVRGQFHGFSLSLSQVQ